MASYEELLKMAAEYGVTVPQPDSTGRPVYLLVQPDGTATWGHVLGRAKDAMGPYGTGSAFVPFSRSVRYMSSDVALVLKEEFAPNPYSRKLVAQLTGAPLDQLAPHAGPVAVYAWDPMNEWDSSRSFTKAELTAIELTAAAVGCTFTNPINDDAEETRP